VTFAIRNGLPGVTWAGRCRTSRRCAELLPVAVGAPDPGVLVVLEDDIAFPGEAVVVADRGPRSGPPALAGDPFFAVIATCSPSKILNPSAEARWLNCAVLRQGTVGVTAAFPVGTAWGSGGAGAASIAVTLVAILKPCPSISMYSFPSAVTTAFTWELSCRTARSGPASTETRRAARGSMGAQYAYRWPSAPRRPSRWWRTGCRRGPTTGRSA